MPGYNETRKAIKQQAIVDARKLLLSTFHECHNNSVPFSIVFSYSRGEKTVIQMDSLQLTRGYVHPNYPRLHARDGDTIVSFDDDNIYAGEEILGKMVFYVTLAEVFMVETHRR